MTEMGTLDREGGMIEACWYEDLKMGLKKLVLRGLEQKFSVVRITWAL